MSSCLFGCLSNHPFTHPPNHQFTYPPAFHPLHPFIHLSIHSPTQPPNKTHLSTYLPICLVVCLSICLIFYLPINPSSHVSAYPPIHSFIHLSIHLPTHPSTYLCVYLNKCVKKQQSTWGCWYIYKHLWKYAHIYQIRPMPIQPKKLSDILGRKAWKNPLIWLMILVMNSDSVCFWAQHYPIFLSMLINSMRKHTLKKV